MTNREELPGKFIVFEGLDGSRAADLASRLVEWLVKQGLHSWLTREPSDGPVGSLLRQWLANRLRLSEEALALCFAADRVDHLYRQGGILDRLRAGDHVVCDRYYLSTYAYQQQEQPADPYRAYIDLGWLRAVNEKWCLEPDLTLFVDVPIDLCLRRMIEVEPRELGHMSVIRLATTAEKEVSRARIEMQRQRQNYLAAIEELKQDRSRSEVIEIIDGSKPPVSVQNDIVGVVKRILAP